MLSPQLLVKRCQAQKRDSNTEQSRSLSSSAPLPSSETLGDGLCVMTHRNDTELTIEGGGFVMDQLVWTATNVRSHNSAVITVSLRTSCISEKTEAEITKENPLANLLFFRDYLRFLKPSADERWQDIRIFRRVLCLASPKHLGAWQERKSLSILHLKTFSKNPISRSTILKVKWNREKKQSPLSWL